MSTAALIPPTDRRHRKCHRLARLQPGCHPSEIPPCSYTSEYPFRSYACVSVSNRLRQLPNMRLCDNVFPRIRQSLRAEFSYLAEVGLGSTDDISPVIFDNGGTIREIDGYISAIAYYEAAFVFSTDPNRALGDVQILWE